MPDRGSEREEPLHHPHDYPTGCSPAVLLEPELPFQRIEHRLNPLPQRFQKPHIFTRGFTLTRWPDQADPTIIELVLEHAPVVALVRHNRLPLRDLSRIRFQDAPKGLALIGFRTGNREPDREPIERRELAQARTPEVAGVRGVVPVLGEPGKVRAFHSLAGTATLYRG